MFDGMYKKHHASPTTTIIGKHISEPDKPQIGGGLDAVLM